MTMRVLLTMLIALAALPAGPAGAATPLTGTYRGRTAQGIAMSIVVNRRHVVTRIRFDLTMNCRDGTTESFFLRYRNLATPVQHGMFNRSWSDTSVKGYFFTATVAGQFPTRRRVTGRVAVGENNAARGGACMTGPVSYLGPTAVTWRASLQALG